MIGRAVKDEKWVFCQWNGKNLDEIKRISNFDDIILRTTEITKRLVCYLYSGIEDERVEITIRLGDVLLSRDNEEYLVETSETFQKDWIQLAEPGTEPKTATPRPTSDPTEPGEITADAA